MSLQRTSVPLEVVSRLGDLARKDPGWLAFWFSVWQKSNSASRVALRRKLSVTERGLRLLLLSGTPRDEHFSKDVGRLALAAGADGDALAALVREARFHWSSKKVPGRHYEAALMAARDVKTVKKTGRAKRRLGKDL
jgi:hypothetical protein